jgi:hypothetical protein
MCKSPEDKTEIQEGSKDSSNQQAADDTSHSVHASVLSAKTGMYSEAGVFLSSPSLFGFWKERNGNDAHGALDQKERRAMPLTKFLLVLTLVGVVYECSSMFKIRRLVVSKMR